MMQNNLKKFRLAQRLTQQDVAEALQIPTNSYQQYEAGSRNMKPEMLIAVARFFDVPIDEIFMHHLPERYISVSADQKRILTKYATLTEQHKRLIRVILEELSAPESGGISMQQNTELRIANRSSGNLPQSEAPSAELNLEQLPDVPEDL